MAGSHSAWPHPHSTARSRAIHRHSCAYSGLTLADFLVGTAWGQDQAWGGAHLLWPFASSYGSGSRPTRGGLSRACNSDVPNAELWSLTL